MYCFTTVHCCAQLGELAGTPDGASVLFTPAKTTWFSLKISLSLFFVAHSRVRQPAYQMAPVCNSVLLIYLASAVNRTHVAVHKKRGATTTPRTACLCPCMSVNAGGGPTTTAAAILEYHYLRCCRSLTTNAGCCSQIPYFMISIPHWWLFSLSAAAAKAVWYW
jgi:hypothetical protein